MKPMLVVVLLCAAALPMGWAQQASSQPMQPQAAWFQLPGILYDDFNQRWLDPSKWLAINPDVSFPSYQEACYYSTNVLECVREIDEGKLRLAVRSLGGRDSDFGTQYGEAKLMFPQPQGIRGITADIAVRSTTAAVCAANPGDYFAAPQAMIAASFFNTGTDDSSGNVFGIVTLAPVAPDNLRTIAISAFYGYQGQYPGYVTLGTVPLGTPVRASLQWDQADHKFVVMAMDLLTHRVFTADVPYGSLPDTKMPVGEWKGFYVQVFPSNCTAQPTWESMEALFDNVVVRR